MESTLKNLSLNPKKKEELDLSDEDLYLKQQLELYVERVGDSDPELQKAGLDGLREQLRDGTGSITSVPMSMKFLHAHYGTLENYYDNMAPDSDLKKVLADILSVLAMSQSHEDDVRATLIYRLLGSGADIGSWGHEYVRKLACEISQECAIRQSEDDLDEDENEYNAYEDDNLMDLAIQIAAYFMNHKAEFEAVDLLVEVENPGVLVEHMTKENYNKTCLYLTNLAMYLKPDDQMSILDIVMSIYTKFEEYSRAVQIALRRHDMKGAQEIFMSCKDLLERHQLCFNIARHGITFWLLGDDIVPEGDELENLQDIMHNNKLSEGYLALARDLDVMEPKSPEYICKANLTEGCGSGSGTVDSAMQNVASTYVNAFVNAGFGQDRLMTVPSDASNGGVSSTNWLYKNNTHGQTSAAASLGMIFLWDIDSGLAQLDKYLRSPDTHVIAGGLLGVGIVNCNVEHPSDPALARLADYVDKEDSSIRIGAIMGLGLAYAGTQNEQVYSKLRPLLRDGKASLDVIAFAAISLGLVYVGSCNVEVAEAIIFALRTRSESELGDPLAPFMPLGLGLLYLGMQERADAAAEVYENLNLKNRNYCGMILLSCVHAGTGDVLKVQDLLRLCAQPNKKCGSYKGQAVLGIAMVAMGEEIGLEMAIRSLEHLLQYGDRSIRKAVPLALGLLCISNPKVNVMEILSRLSHDRDIEVARTAIISLGLIGAGTNNAKIAGMLLNLSSYYYANARLLFCVRIAQGLIHMGKGLMTLSPYHSERFLLSPPALAGLVIMLHACLDMEAIVSGEYHYVLYFLALAMQPKMLMTVGEDLNPLSVPVRVGQAVDVVGKPGHPKTITSFLTHNTPVLLSAGERAELATEKYIPLTPILEGFVILRVNPDFHEDL